MSPYRESWLSAAEAHRPRRRSRRPSTWADLAHAVALGALVLLARVLVLALAVWMGLLCLAAVLRLAGV